MNIDHSLLLTMLEELIDAWSINQTPVGIGSDVPKLRLLRRVRDELLKQGEEPPENIRAFYEKVFLRDEFSTDESSGY